MRFNSFLWNTYKNSPSGIELINLDKANDNTVYNWQGNPDTQPGDIIVMYCLSPRSYIHSIWRAVTPGSIDPFFYFYRNVYIGHPIFVEHISLNEIKNDELLSQMPLVKKNMQGINGRIIEKKYYDRLLVILESKGQNIDLLPKLDNIEIPSIEIKNERDVEIYLLDPLLEKLDYNQQDWKHQLKVRMGRREKIIPDYVIFPNEEKGNESGFWVFEAKHSIESHKQLKIDFEQAKSYALRLQGKGLCLVSISKAWV
jgi:hypothetical protein